MSDQMKPPQSVATTHHKKRTAPFFVPYLASNSGPEAMSLISMLTYYDIHDESNVSQFGRCCYAGEKAHVSAG